MMESTIFRSICLDRSDSLSQFREPLPMQDISSLEIVQIYMI